MHVQGIEPALVLLGITYWAGHLYRFSTVSPAGRGARLGTQWPLSLLDPLLQALFLQPKNRMCFRPPPMHSKHLYCSMYVGTHLSVYLVCLPVLNRLELRGCVLQCNMGSVILSFGVKSTLLVCKKAYHQKRTGMVLRSSGKTETPLAHQHATIARNMSWSMLSLQTHCTCYKHCRNSQRIKLCLQVRCTLLQAK